MSRRAKRRHSRPPMPWTDEQKARIEAWDKGVVIETLVVPNCVGIEAAMARARRDIEERIGLPRFNPYSIPAKDDPKAVDCPYCVKRPRNLQAHCRAVHPDKPEAR